MSRLCLLSAMGGLGALGGGIGIAGFAPTASAAPPEWPSRVAATYAISFVGVEIGKFDFTSSVNGKSYVLESSAKLSALLGAFKWKGSTRSSGGLSGVEPRPTGYTFDYRSNKKSGSVKLGFDGSRVANVSVVPPPKDRDDEVPLQPRHMQNVLDPLTAVLSMSKLKPGNPCAQRLPIFDGKQRFDLVMSFVRQVKIAEGRPSGQPNVGYVCRVRYVPIAGYRMNKETRYMASNNDIEVTLRPVPEANLVIPHMVRIPTIAGSAVMTSQRIEIITSANKQIALIN